jgi:signal recognition particle subunit SRP9
MKYRHCDGKLVLKVTDNKECLKFKTDQAQEAKKMEKLNNIFFTLMARGPDVDLSEVTGKEQMETQPAKKGRGRKFDFIHSLVLCSLSLSILTFDQKSNGMHNGNGAREEEEEADKEHFMENQSRD